jgi:hypothetical protein
VCAKIKKIILAPKNKEYLMDQLPINVHGERDTIKNNIPGARRLINL